MTLCWWKKSIDCPVVAKFSSQDCATATCCSKPGTVGLTIDLFDTSIWSLRATRVFPTSLLASSCFEKQKRKLIEFGPKLMKEINYSLKQQQQRQPESDVSQSGQGDERANSNPSAKIRSPEVDFLSCLIHRLIHPVSFCSWSQTLGSQQVCYSGLVCLVRLVRLVRLAMET